ncbi:hypothetical protein OHV05_29060 [Kitasatospora sp. NBC_00070]|uniref:hypothetical protein n=1 Tax=Kitasatospora sp. NBC_00070 TaxID=2975962 RepID=UPI00324ED3F5
MAREVLLPVYIHGPDRRTLKETKRRLVAALNPKRGYALLRFTESNGQSRYLHGYYKDGMEGTSPTTGPGSAG